MSSTLEDTHGEKSRSVAVGTPPGQGTQQKKNQIRPPADRASRHWSICSYNWITVIQIESAVLPIYIGLSHSPVWGVDLSLRIIIIFIFFYKRIRAFSLYMSFYESNVESTKMKGSPNVSCLLSFASLHRVSSQPAIISLFLWSWGSEVTFIWSTIVRVPQPWCPSQDSAVGVQCSWNRPADCQVKILNSPLKMQ